MRPPRIAVVTPSTDPNAGGVERYCATLADVIASWGWEPHLVEPDARVPALLERGLGTAVRSRSAARRVRQVAPDLVVTNGPLGVGHRGTAPRVHVYHGTMPARFRVGFEAADSLRYRIRLTAEIGGCEWRSGLGAHRIAVSDGCAADVRRTLGLRVHEVIDVGVDVGTFVPRDRGAARARLGLDPADRFALFVGHADRRKGADVFMDACARAGYRPLVAGRSIPGATNLGRLGTDGLVDAYAAADVVTFPSRYEAAGLAMLESLACGATTLTTEVGTVPGLLRRVPELREWVITASADDLARRLQQLEGRTERDAALAVRARTVVAESYATDCFAARWRATLEARLHR